MKSQRTKLGIIDWGIGGISIVRLLRETGKTFPVIYLSDTGATPYGRMKREELISRLDSVIDFLRKKEITHIVVGCNAASTAIPYLNSDGIIVKGVIESAVKISAQQKPQNLAVIGGKRTILSGIYRKEFAKRGIKVKQRIAQPLSALIESGDVSSSKLYDEAQKILAPIKRSSHILLACTHYPAIADILKQIASPATKLIDPAEELAAEIAGWKISENGVDEFYTTGDSESMKKSAKQAFGFSVKEIEKVQI